MRCSQRFRLDRQFAPITIQKVPIYQNVAQGTVAAYLYALIIAYYTSDQSFENLAWKTKPE